MNRMIDALVPMKGHSERVKNKNIRDFAGKPLFYYVINALLSSEYISRIIIDTDSEQIKETVNFFFTDERICLLDRPEELCGDFAPFFDLLEYDMGHSESELFLQTHATNPLLSETTISGACSLFIENRDKYDSLFTVNELHTRLYNDRGKAMNHDPDYLIRTQDLPPVYEENSNLYLFSRESFQKRHNRIGETPYLYVTPPLESVDIDTEEEFLLAEAIYKNRIKEKK